MSSRLLRVLFLTSTLALSACLATTNDTYDSPAAGMLHLGDQVMAKGETGAAIDFYRRGYQLDKSNLTLSKHLAEALEAFGDAKGAFAVYKDTLETHPEDFDVQRNYARLALTFDKPLEAKRHYQAALLIRPGDTKSINGLAVAYDYLGDHAKAQGQYKKVLAAEPDNLSALNNMAYSYILTRRYSAAIEALEPQLAKQEGTPALRQNLALAYGLSGRDEDAERVAKMDLPADKVEQNMAYYKRKRAELAVSGTPYAELGTYASEEQAVAEIEKLRPEMRKVGGYLKPVVMPEVASPGEKPRYAVRMMGCARPKDVDHLCQAMEDLGVPCVAKGGKEAEPEEKGHE
ncbi:MAG: tetratricopeptide repeat protein [Alphaproteobacteria bacterium]|nr:tetratricopeptide repeat protein [Alphaproteobacteria bacterium]